MKRQIYLLIAGSMLSLSSLAQASIEPDLSFGGSGTGRNISAGVSEFRALARQSDGKYLAGGSSRSLSGLEAISLRRFKEDGTLDPTFVFVKDGYEGKIFDILIGAGDEIIVSGHQVVGGAQTGFVGKYNKDGSALISSKFFAANSMVYKMAMLADGSILAAGREMISGEDRARIWKLKSDLSGLVSGFGSGGVIKIEDGNPYSWVAGFSSFYGIDVLPSGQILACGSYRTTASTAPQGFLSRWTAGGLKDDASGFYSTYNIATWNSSGAAYEYYDIGFHASGFFDGGYLTDKTSGYISARGQSLDYSSGLNTSKGGNSYVYNLYVPPYDVITDLTKLSDLSCVFLGNSGASATSTQIWLSKLNASLYRDTTFHRLSGVPGSHSYFLPLGSGNTSENGFDFLVNADSSMVIAGSATKGGNTYACLTKLKYNRSSTAVSELSVQSLPALYPNPATDYISLQLPASFGASPAIAVYNTLGQLVWSQQGGDRIAVASLPQGQYTILADGKPLGRFIKQ